MNLHTFINISAFLIHVDISLILLHKLCFHSDFSKILCILAAGYAWFYFTESIQFAELSNCKIMSTIPLNLELRQ
jgi:hypothetical protein